MSTRFKICLAVWIAVVALAASTGKVHAQDGSAPEAVIEVQEVLTPVPRPSDDEWVIEITPARKVVTTSHNVTEAASPDADEQCQNCGHARAKAEDYTAIYNSIPFNRAEHNANPSYRHDATMEILTGNARHMTVVQHGAKQPAATRPARSTGQTVIPYGYVRPSLRLNYYRHFPSLNPYWNLFWNFSGIY